MDGLITDGNGIWARREASSTFLPERLYADANFGIVVSRYEEDHSFEVHNGNWVGDYVDGAVTVRLYPGTPRPTTFHEIVGMTTHAAKHMYVHCGYAPLLDEGQEGYGLSVRGRKMAKLKPVGDEVIALIDSMDDETVKSLLYHLADRGKVSGMVAAVIDRMAKTDVRLGKDFDDDVPF